MTLLYQSVDFGVQPDHLPGLIAGVRGGANEHRHSADAVRVLGRKGQLVRCGTAATHDVDGLKPEVIQDRREIVSRLTEAPPRQPSRGAEARTLGRNDPQMPP